MPTLMNRVGVVVAQAGSSTIGRTTSTAPWSYATSSSRSEGAGSASKLARAPEFAPLGLRAALVPCGLADGRARELPAAAKARAWLVRVARRTRVRRTSIAHDSKRRGGLFEAISGQIAFDGQRWQPQSALTVNTRQDGEAARELAAFWASLGAERLKLRQQGNFAYNLFEATSRYRLGQIARLGATKLRSRAGRAGPHQRYRVNSTTESSTSGHFSPL